MIRRLPRSTRTDSLFPDTTRCRSRAIADAVAGPVRLAAAEMVPMGGINHHFIGPFAARQDADDIFRRLLADAVGERDRCLQVQRYRPEALAPGGGGQGVEILAGGGDRKSTRLNSSH